MLPTLSLACCAAEANVLGHISLSALCMFVAAEVDRSKYSGTADWDMEARMRLIECVFK